MPWFLKSKTAKNADLFLMFVDFGGHTPFGPWTERRQKMIEFLRAAAGWTDNMPAGAGIFLTSAGALKSALDADEELRGIANEQLVQGNWECAGGLWVVPLTSAVDGESIARQLLLGQRFLKGAFNRTPRVAVDFLNDWFPAGLPSLLRCAGIEVLVALAREEDAAAVPTCFRWESPDGKAIAVALAKGVIVPSHGAVAAQLVDLLPKETEEKEKIEAILAAVALAGISAEGLGSALKEIEKTGRKRFRSVFFSLPVDGGGDENLPRKAGVLRLARTGAILNVTSLKRLARRCENRLLAAERWMVFAGRQLGVPYQNIELWSAWQKLLRNQACDVLGGLCSQDAYDEVRQDLGQALRAADEAIKSVYKAIRQRVDTTGEGEAFIVFNPLPWRRKAAIESSMLTAAQPFMLAASDPEGRVLPCQVTTAQPHPKGLKIGFVFQAELPAMGYKVFHIRPARPNEFSTTTLAVGPYSIENNHLRVELDPYLGYVEQILDKRIDQNVLAAKANVFVVFDDPSNAWGHGFTKLTLDIGRFMPISDVEFTEVGPIRAVIRVHTKFAGAPAVQDVLLYDDCPDIDFRTTIDWSEKTRAVRMVFPTALSGVSVFAESACAIVRGKADGEEFPMTRWVLLQGGLGSDESCRNYHLAMLNDDCFSFSLEDGQLAVSVVHSPPFLGKELAASPELEAAVAALGADQAEQPADESKTEQPAFMDLGKHELRYRLVCGEGQWDPFLVLKKAYEQAFPVECFAVEKREGEMPKFGQFADYESNGVLLTAAKLSEDQSMVVLRLREVREERSEATIRFGTVRRPIHVSLEAHEVKTVGIRERGRDVDVVELDLLENVVEPMGDDSTEMES